MSDEHFAVKMCITVGVVAFVIGLSLGANAVNSMLVKPLRKEAVERGHAEYSVSSDGEAVWRWKE